ncbi:hypothetical protein CMO90_00805 [Candidatus Woesearchaeota archaeon]|jgi:presenilin-like A22 family membrane protease|nr:hypothetical protein [Candidatus Woesearchaeota archaeon]|tara:strand:- start:686 stop:1582 length:897 start_codon:yes stop_codon:yes gene_type:complete
MKHDLNVIIIIVSIFLLTQIFGLFLINKDISSIKKIDDAIVIEHQETTLGPRPETTGFSSFIFLSMAVLIGTLLLLLIMKYGKVNLWKTWFFLAVFFSISISLGVLIEYELALFFAFILSFLKMFKRNVLVHNFTEVLMYSGLAVLIVPIFDLQWVFIMLIVISIYDMYAVWKSKHMVKMAKFQAKNNLFAGLMIPYEQNKKIHLKISKKIKRTKVHNALLGGGDVAFPLIFAGVVMESLIKKGFTPQLAFFQTITISFLVTGAVIGLFVFAKKKKFYPAMPFISIACFIGYFVISLF